MKWLIPLALLVTGCSGHTHSSVTFGAVSVSGGSVHTHIEGAAGLAALLGIVVVASAVESERGVYGTDSSRRAPEMAAERKVSEQDCTKPIDFSLGNIRCK
jgi:hypothetical protein